MTSAAPDAFTLYSYFRSSAAYRVRIALNLKGIKPDYRFVHLVKDGGQQHRADYTSVNPQALIPTFVHGSQVIGQSLAILEYLEEVAPGPALLPADPTGRARVRQLALMIACDIHPLNNTRVQAYLRRELGRSEPEIATWVAHWIGLGFDALETMLAGSSTAGRFCHGDRPTFADICLIPQMANARRARMELGRYPTLLRIEAAAFTLPEFTAARPENQPDAE